MMKMRIRRFALRAALCLALCSAMAPCVAYADDAGSAEESASAEAAVETRSSAPSADRLAEVVVGEDGDSAVSGAPFAFEGFSRAQAGTARTADDGTFVGYCYYSANSPGRLSAVVTEDYAVVYVPQSALDTMGCTLEEAAADSRLAAMFIALDGENAKGGPQLSADTEWVFTSDAAYERDGVLFEFDREVQAGRFFTVVVGADGTDVTDEANPAFVRVTQVDFASVSPAEGVDVAVAATGFSAFVQWMGSIDLSPLYITLKTSLTAIVFIFVLGLAAAYFSLRIPSRAQDIVDSVFTIPMVLPPTVCGFLLLLAFGRNTALGQWFIDIGFPLVFSWPATVIAAVVVAFPLMYRSARGAFEGLDSNMLDAARTLGWSNARIFFRLMLPLSWSSIAAGTVLAFARALGEFGATLFLAGNYLGITRTIPIAIYFEWMNGNTDIAIFWTAIIIIFSFIVILFINLWSRRTTKYRRGSAE